MLLVRCEPQAWSASQTWRQIREIEGRPRVAARHRGVARPNWKEFRHPRAALLPAVLEAPNQVVIHFMAELAGYSGPWCWLSGHRSLRPKSRRLPIQEHKQKGAVAQSDVPRVKEAFMDKDRIKGAAKDLKGKAKEAVGKITGDAKSEAEGKADQVKGKAQNAVGGAKDALKK